MPWFWGHRWALVFWGFGFLGLRFFGLLLKVVDAYE
jgi:hypothetical protein